MYECMKHLKKTTAYYVMWLDCVLGIKLSSTKFSGNDPFLQSTYNIE